ncbi:MAG: AMP-binding protein, partial [Rubrivivax sp.]|nr:AMP-binding protein [Rubrivivax sp.]
MSTFPQLMLQHAAQRPQEPALRIKEFGIWQTMTWADLALLVRHLAGGLAEAGLQQGEHVVVIGENRPRLYAAMLATQALGGIPVPLYQDAASAEFVFPIQNAEVRFAFVEDQEQVDKLIEIRPDCPQITRIWYDEPRGLRHYEEPGLAWINDLIEAGRQHAQSHPGFLEAAVAKVQPQDVAAMFFTSGTTGKPKGVVHTHFTLLDRAAAGARFDKLTAH